MGRRGVRSGNGRGGERKRGEMGEGRWEGREGKGEGRKRSEKRTEGSMKGRRRKKR